jgi:predicted Rossmann fold nucleotide-binding protein DprA/Smf involved in DNA uptake
LSSGTNALLAAGAQLVRDVQDALDLLDLGGQRPSPRRGARAALDPKLRRVLEEVSGGRDTPDLLVHGGQRLPALSELELRGLLARGDGGRYLARAPMSTSTAVAHQESG